MGKAVLTEFEWWNVTEVRIPERSILYSPAPIGMGTAMGESLTSYLARLAEAHCVYPGVLLQEMVVPLMMEAEVQGNAFDQHPMFRRDGSGSHLINVAGSRSRAALHVLETLTLRTDLRGLSLAALTELLPVRGLTRNRVAWCPRCYEEWQESGQILYGPLLWIFREISLCTRHGVRLHMHCPHCARSLPHLTWRFRPGYCAFCAGPLFGEGGRAGVVAKDSSEFAWQQWVTHALGTVIARLPGISAQAKRERIRQVVRNAVEQLADGNIVAFARLLGLSPNTLKNWCQGKRIPEMDMLLRLCYRLDLSLCEVLFQEGETPHPSLREPVEASIFRSRERMAINKDGVSHQLEQVASRAEDPPSSLKEASQRLGYQPTTLYKINRAACHAIAEHYTAHRRELREKRLQGYREEIRQIALYLQAEQVALTQRHIRRYLAQPAILRDPKVRELLREVCQEVECFDTASPFPPGKETLPLREHPQKGDYRMSTEENKAFMHRVYEEVYNQRNLAVLDEVCVPDFVVHYPSRTLQGLEAYKRFVSLLFSAFPDGRYRIEDMIAEGDRVVVRHTFGGTHQGDFMGIPPTSKYITTTAIVISRISNGKGIEAWINGDDLGRLQQLGVIPPLGQAS